MGRGKKRRGSSTTGPATKAGRTQSIIAAELVDAHLLSAHYPILCDAAIGSDGELFFAAYVDERVVVAGADGRERARLSRVTVTEDIYARRSPLSLSPSGKEAALLTQDEDERARLFLISLKDGKTLCLDIAPEIGFPTWISEDELVYMRAGGDALSCPALCSLDLRNMSRDEAKHLLTVPADGDSVGLSAIARWRAAGGWSPLVAADGRTTLYPYGDGQHTRIGLADRMTTTRGRGGPKSLTGPHGWDYEERPVALVGERQVVVLGREGGVDTLYLASLDGWAVQSPRALFECTGGASSNPAAMLTPDGRAVLYVGGTDLFLIPLDGGEARLLLSGVDPTGDLVCDPTGAHVICHGANLSEPQHFLVPLGAGEPVVIDSLNGESVVEVLSWDSAGRLSCLGHREGVYGLFQGRLELRRPAPPLGPRARKSSLAAR